MALPTEVLLELKTLALAREKVDSGKKNTKSRNCTYTRTYFYKLFFLISECLLRWGWVFLKRTRTLNGIQFTTHFIKKIDAKTKRFVGSFVNVILTRQTCGQRSSRAAESKRRALWNNFSERICYMFPISKCRGDRDLGLCTTSILAKREPRSFGQDIHNIYDIW